MAKPNKIVVLDGYTENPGDLSWDILSSQTDNFILYDRTAPEDIVARIADAQVVLTNKTPVSKETMDACPNLSYIGVLATEYNVVDVAAASERGITVTNIPTYGTDAVAQYTMALLLELCHHVGAHNDSVHRGDWSRSKDFCYWNYPLTELSGKTMGIIGYGRIGQAVALRAKAFGMNILAYSHGDIPEDGIAKSVPLQELLSNSDVVSLHCPLTPQTNELINETAIQWMKDGAMLINTARGPLVNEKAVADALSAGKLAGMASDVCTVEPVAASNPLLSAPNCILTPHIAWAAKESRERLMKIAGENLIAYLEGHPQNVV